jgi:hypothetical protein
VLDKHLQKHKERMEQTKRDVLEEIAYWEARKLREKKGVHLPEDKPHPDEEPMVEWNLEKEETMQERKHLEKKYGMLNAI